MGNAVLYMSMSLDGFVAGPNVSTEQPMGEGAGASVPRLDGQPDMVGMSVTPAPCERDDRMDQGVRGGHDR
jgi:hypothetical protein